MKKRISLLAIARLLFSALAASLLLGSCGPQTNGPSDIPWNHQESWEGTARYGNFPQSR